jgi:hypothetical protein
MIHVTKTQHSLLMQCLALFEFKDIFSQAYIACYPQVYRRLLNFQTTDNTALFTFSVQFMNRKTHVVPLVDQCYYYHIMLVSVLKCIMEGTYTDANKHARVQNTMEKTLDGRLFAAKGVAMTGTQRTMLQRTYRLPLTDMRYALNNQGMQRKFIETIEQFQYLTDFSCDYTKLPNNVNYGFLNEQVRQVYLSTPFSNVLTCVHLFSLVFTGFHWFSLVFTCFHLFSLVSLVSFSHFSLFNTNHPL